MNDIEAGIYGQELQDRWWEKKSTIPVPSAKKPCTYGDLVNFMAIPGTTRGLAASVFQGKIDSFTKIVRRLCDWYPRINQRLEAADKTIKRLEKTIPIWYSNATHIKRLWTRFVGCKLSVSTILSDPEFPNSSLLPLLRDALGGLAGHKIQRDFKEEIQRRELLGEESYFQNWVHVQEWNPRPGQQVDAFLDPVPWVIRGKPDDEKIWEALGYSYTSPAPPVSSVPEAPPVPPVHPQDVLDFP